MKLKVPMLRGLFLVFLCVPWVCQADDEFDRSIELANDYSRQGLWDEAIAAYDRAIEIRPDDGNAHYNLGRILFHKRYDLINKNQLKDLKGYLKKCETPSWEPEGFVLDGEDPVTKELLQREVQEWKTAVVLDDKIAGAHHFLGLYYNKFENDLIKAEDHLKRAIALNPEFPTSYGLLASVFEKKGDHQGAMRCYNKILELYPQNLLARHDLALLYLKLGMNKEARKLYEYLKSKQSILADDLAPKFTAVN